MDAGQPVGWLRVSRAGFSVLLRVGWWSRWIGWWERYVVGSAEAHIGWGRCKAALRRVWAGMPCVQHWFSFGCCSAYSVLTTVIRSNGEFQITRNVDTNLHVTNGELYITPSLVSAEIDGGYPAILDGGSFDLGDSCSTDNTVCISCHSFGCALLIVTGCRRRVLRHHRTLLVLSSTLCSRLGLARRATTPSSMARSRSSRSFPKVTGSGPPFGCCPRTLLMVLGHCRAKST